MKTYRKTRKNPLGLGVTTITNETFTDAEITDKDKAKLELAIKSGMVVEVNTELEDAKAKEELSKSTNELEATKKALETSQLRVKELEAQLKKCEDLKAFAYELMDADELAKFYTVDELKAFATKLEIDFKANEKEASLASKIVEKLEK